MKLLNVENLSVGYESKVVAQNINFSVNQGDYLCIVGENGSGKSTLMKTLLGLLSPIAGNIEFGQGIKKNGIGYLPQQTQIQRDFPASVWEIVLSGCQAKAGLRPFYNKAEKELALKNIERMNILNLKKCCYRELSGGQQQRVLLARALCATEKILLMDEPVSGLDPKVTQELYDLIAKLNSEGISIIMVSHDVQAAAKYASHILHVGKKIFYGTKEDYLKSDTGRLFFAEEA